MITVSIQPFGRRKLAALGVALLCASTASCFADAMYLTSSQAALRQAQSERASELRLAVQTAPREPQVSRWTANFRQVGQSTHAIPAPASDDSLCGITLRAS